MKSIKAVVVGDGAVGKTCLLKSYTEATFSTEYIPTVFDNYAANVMVDGKPINMGLWDTAGQEDFERLRPLSYSGTDVFLLCFSVVSPTSFKNLTTTWLPEIRLNCPKAAIVLIGTKSDLKDDFEVNDMLRERHMAPVTKLQAEEFVLQNKLSGYMETSAVTGRGLKEAFDLVIRSGLIAKYDDLKNKKRPTSFGKLVNGVRKMFSIGAY